MGPIQIISNHQGMGAGLPNDFSILIGGGDWIYPGQNNAQTQRTRGRPSRIYDRISGKTYICPVGKMAVGKMAVPAALASSGLP